MNHTLQQVKRLRVVLALGTVAILSAAFANVGVAWLGPAMVRLAGWQFIPSSTAWLTGASFSIACMVVLAVTLLFGRVYCSVLCPLGIMQDVMSRLASWFHRHGKNRLRYTPPRTAIRHVFLWSALLTIPVGGAGLLVGWLDPFSLFGRIVSQLVRPVYIGANNLLVPLAHQVGWHGIHRIELAPIHPMILAITGALFCLLLFMAVWRGRLYCNTICPVGTLLGFISSQSLFRFQIAPEACGKCAECLKGCKAHCIDLKNGTVDASRCVACFNCVESCDRGAMRYTTTWKWPMKEEPSRQKLDSGRRSLLVKTAGAALLGGGALFLPAWLRAASDSAAGQKNKFSRVITPPTSLAVQDFLERCTACQLCVSGCPTGVLQPSTTEYGPLGAMKPRMDFEVSFCNFDCHRCQTVCPTGAITLMPLAQKQITRIGISRFIKHNCIVYTDGTDCGACSEHCPTKAVYMVRTRRGTWMPRVREELCIGCGACEYACPAKPKAIVVDGIDIHDQAIQHVEPKAESPIPQDGFPF